MPDYSKGKIYKIYCNITGETYYGSSCNTLAKRMGSHREKAKLTTTSCTSKSIINRGDYDYSLIEKYECNNKQELHARERYWIENNECVNRKVPGRTPKEWYQNNKDKILKIQKVWNQNNKEKMKAYHELYRKENKEKKKEWYQNNKEKRKENEKQKVVCECGCESTPSNISRHRKSKFHQEFIQSLGSGGNTI